MKASVFISFIIYLILPELHILISHLPAHNVDWFLWSNHSQDIQYYLKDNLSMLALVILLFAIRTFTPFKIRPYINCIITIKILEIPLYWLTYLHYDIALILLAFTITYITTITHEKRNNIRTST